MCCCCCFRFASFAIKLQTQKMKRNACEMNIPSMDLLVKFCSVALEKRRGIICGKSCFSVRQPRIKTLPETNRFDDPFKTLQYRNKNRKLAKFIQDLTSLINCSPLKILKVPYKTSQATGKIFKLKNKRRFINMTDRSKDTSVLISTSSDYSVLIKS